MNNKMKKKNKQIQIYKKFYINVLDTKSKKIQNNKTKNKLKHNYINLNQTINEINDFNYDGDNSCSEDSFENMCMKTARNKWRNKKEEPMKQEKININIEETPKREIKEKIKTNNKETYEVKEILEIKDDLRIYKYCSKPRENPHKLIFKYYYDKFDRNDYDNAYIILFIGKTGDGKSTAINALFNIIKGIKLEDKQRFILIPELNKKKGQAESQTDGIHLYYIKDCNKKPIIIIDTQGFGDTRGKKYDELTKEAFEYAFTKIIKHINLVCFIAKSTDCRLDILTKYIFCCATSLFSEDINQNFIFLTTFANRSTISNGPEFIASIKSEPNFNDIIKNMNEKWYYSAESVSILDNDIDRITKYSFQQLTDLYEEKIKNLKNININKSCQIIKNRNKIKTIIKDIILIYHKIMNEKNKISDIDTKISEYETKLSDINYRIENKKFQVDQVYIPDKDYHLDRIKSDRDRRINYLDNQYEEKEVRKLKYDGGDHTYCNYCERNCHEYCYCIGSLFDRCTIFPIFGNDCKYCGHHKSHHTIHGGSKWVNETERNKIDNYSKIQEENDYYWKKYNEINDEYNSKMEEKNERQNELNKLNEEKNKLENEKNNYINNKTQLNSQIKKITSELKIKILDLIKIANSIKNIAMNTFYYDIENLYIDYLIQSMEEIGGEKKEEIKGLKENKKYNDLFLEISNMKEEELIYDDELMNKIKKFI